MIKQYSHDEHFETLKKWNDLRGQTGLEKWMLPDLGFVCDGRAMAFLMTTNSPVAWIAHWAIDPSLNEKGRDQSIGELVNELEWVASDRGFKLIETLGKTGHHMADRLRKNGYLEAPGEFTFFVKSLEKGV